jgi:Reverse transcriptase (RNA-dependent DNA polymerase)/Endonuclease-reverse transcriptase
LTATAADVEPDLILITETWCHKDINNAYLSLPGYELQHELRQDRVDTKEGRGGGLLVYAKQGLNILAADSNIDFVQHCKFYVHDLTCFLIYRPPNGTVENMTKLAELIRTADKNTIFIGDFNLPGVDWNTGASRGAERLIVEAAQDMFCEQLVEFSTHTRGNILDLVLTNIPDRISEVREEGHLGNSDHTTIIVEVKVGSGSAPEMTQARPDWARADWDKMREMTSQWNWRDELRGVDATEAWNKFKDRVANMVEECVPKRRRRNQNRPPWLSQEILREIRRRKRMWARDKHKANKDEYKEQDKKTRNMIRAAKRKFERKIAEGGGQNKRPFYAYVKTRTKTRQSVGPLKDEDGATVSDPKNMADLLNKTFGEAFTRENVETVPEPQENHDGEQISHVRVTVKDVKNKIRRLRRDAASGPDGIGPAILMEMCNEFAPIMAQIFNKSLQTGDVPEDWREANVTPIFKKGTRTAAGNYRPVSLTSVCCKILESVIKDRIMEHLRKHKLIRNSQHGFLPGRSCATNLLSFFEKVTSEVDSGHAFDAIFLDFAKAFDKVPTERLLKKVKAHGIRGQLLNWIENWLKNRRQRVVLAGEFSEWIAVLSGVPQGSVLGPLLFLIFINDLDLAASEVSIMSKFADDTKVGQSIITEADRDKLQEVLQKLCAWTDLWGMQFNVKKCKIMHFGRNNPQYDYEMNGEKLERVEEERDIGVTVNKNLKPSSQCSKAANTARTVLGQISRAFHYRDKRTFVKLYTTYVRPHLEFCTPAWSPWTRTDIDCLEKVQRRMVGMVSGLSATNYEDKLLELGLESLEARRKNADIHMMHKLVHGIGDIDRSTWFENLTGNNMTRARADPLNVKCKHGTLEIRKNFFSNRIVKGWNEIPAEIKNISTPGKFKQALLRWQRGIWDRQDLMADGAT